MPDPTGRFGRSDRLLRSSDYSRVGRTSRRTADSAFVLLVVSQPEGATGAPQRLGITMSRKVGGAVVRNRVKRRVREWFRSSRAKLGTGIDLVVIGRSGAATLSARETEGRLCRLAQALGSARR